MFHISVCPASPFWNDSQTQKYSMGGLPRIQHTRPVSTLEANPVLGVDFGTQKQGQREGSPLWGALPLTPFWVSVLAPRTGLASGTRVTPQVGGRDSATHTLKTDARAVSRLALMPDPCLGSGMCITSVMEVLCVMSGRVVIILTTGIALLCFRCEVTITIKMRRFGGMW